MNPSNCVKPELNDPVIAFTCPSSTLLGSRCKGDLKMLERRQTWSDQEIAALLAKWTDETIQVQLLGEVRNIVPYRAIANELRRQGYERDYKQCHEKIKAMKKTYKETMDSLRWSDIGVDSDNNLEDIHPRKHSVVCRDSRSFGRQSGSQSPNTIEHLEA